MVLRARVIYRISAVADIFESVALLFCFFWLAGGFSWIWRSVYTFEMGLISSLSLSYIMSMAFSSDYWDSSCLLVISF